MPAARSRDELIQVTTRDYAKLQKLLETVDVALVERVDADGWSIRDVIAHRAHWADLFLHWHAEAVAGRAVQTSADGYKWSQLKDYNVMILAQSAG